MQLEFGEARAASLADNIQVDPARGSGHAWGAAMRSEKAHLRTRVEEGGMNYKGFNIAVHEMGHNVEQTLSLNDIDHTLLRGVPNTAFTEALAFVFQARDLELLGLASPDAESEARQTLDAFGARTRSRALPSWICASGTGCTTTRVQPPPRSKRRRSRLRRTSGIGTSPRFSRTRDVVLLGIYSHMIHSFLYLPDYPIGQMIAVQIEEQMKQAGVIGPEFERIARYGALAPDLWMRNATGSPVGPEALLVATERALAAAR